MFMISYFILIIKQLVLCRKYKENLHTDRLAGAERVERNVPIHVVIANKDVFVHQIKTADSFATEFAQFGYCSLS